MCIGMTGTTTGVVDLYLDGEKKATIDMTATTATYKVMLWSTGNISDGAHYVQLKRSGTSAAGKFITLDSVDIWGTIQSAPVSAHTVYDQLDTHIVYSPVWDEFIKTSAYAGSYSRSAVAGATATIYFTGTRLDCVSL